MFCKKCGAQIPDQSKFCPRCGTAQSVGAPATPASGKKKKRIGLAVVMSVILLALVILLVKAGIPAMKYHRAVKLAEDGRYTKAYVAFLDLGFYRDSVTQANKLHDEHPEECPADGDTIIFGSYEQDNDTSNGKEDIEWLVLDVENGRALVISKYILDCVPYNDKYEAITWEECNLRTWLNRTFFNEAFSAAEQQRIPELKVDNSSQVIRDQHDRVYEINNGNHTYDRVFLLSRIEAIIHFSSEEDAQAVGTAYAQRDNLRVDDGYSSWWLRTSGFSAKDAAYVECYGVTDASGQYVNEDNCGVRPAMWIELEG